MKTIYALVDPFTNELKYIGQTVDPIARLAGHFASRCGTPVAEWVRALRTEGVKPTLIELETVAKGEHSSAELFWIEYYSKMMGVNLLNLVGNGIVREKGRIREVTEDLRAIYRQRRIPLRPILELREKAGLSQHQVAAKVKSSLGWVKGCDRGNMDITLYRAYLLANALDCTVEQLRLTR